MTAQHQVLKIRRPDDWHIHLRDGAMLNAVLPYTSAVNARAIVMPNLVPPVTSVDAAIAYRERIMATLPAENIARKGLNVADQFGVVCKYLSNEALPCRGACCRIVVAADDLSDSILSRMRPQGAGGKINHPTGTPDQ